MSSSYNLRVPYGMAVHGREEESKVLKVLREKRTILGRETDFFEKKIAKIFGKKYGIMVNSGSSANLLATELMQLPEKSEVITPILTFATTVSPLVMKNLTPVFVDVEEGSYLINLDQLEKAITQKTRALMIPLLLGNVPDLEKIKAIVKKYRLFLILDSCDTLGATYRSRRVGQFADICTTSFYGSHIITSGGNGGMLLVDSKTYLNKAKILRGWGRGSAVYDESESLEKRFRTKIEDIPYDAKFIFTDIGYNFLPMELGSAFGNAQLDKLKEFQRIRINNFKSLYKFFKNYEDLFILPKQNPLVFTQWLCFPLTIKENAPFDRMRIVSYLEKNNIQTRPIFTGIITKQPGFKNIEHKPLFEDFPVSRKIMEKGFVFGCHQGLEEKHLDKIKLVFKSFLRSV
jgi:CDP-4-dehydro-6-deoxyglucose reductase, E1